MTNNLSRAFMPEVDPVKSIYKDNIITDNLRRLKKYQSRLTPQQYKTLRGQIIAGDIHGAKKGLHKIIER